MMWSANLEWSLNVAPRDDLREPLCRLQCADGRNDVEVHHGGRGVDGHGPQQMDGPGDAGASQVLGFFNGGDGKTLHANALEVATHRNSTVPVRIGLHHCTQLSTYHP